MFESRGALGVLRNQRPGTHGVGGMELFFDLVYVFTIIQLSHFLLHHHSWQGAAEAAVLFAAVWWGWNYTAWAMNWLDPQHAAVRVLLAFLMLCALGMAIAIPESFGERAWLFVGAYVTFQIVRSAFMVLAFRGQQMGKNYAQLLAWSGLASVVWIAGAAAPEEYRLAIWALAVVVDYAGPLVGFWLPGVGTSDMSTWPLDEPHLAERSRLVFIIALGESILILGGVLLEAELSPAVVTAAVMGFCAIVILWWLYFSARHGNADHEAPALDKASQVARAAYAYAHAFMVAGAIVAAVAVELVVAHPLDNEGWPVALTLSAGPALYLLGNIVFVAAHTGRAPTSRIVALGLLALVVPLNAALINLLAGAVVTVILLGLLLSTVTLRQSSRPEVPAH
ncbi:low temperature requirement protein A [Kocuria polaris]|nr:low temperature requirement protein A [Kocuria polaris]